MSGTVNLSRDLWDDEAFRDESFSEREAWMWLIAEASWKARSKRVGDSIVSLDRAQLAASPRFMASAWKWSHGKVRRFLERLEKLEKIRLETGTGITVVTICKYDKYQNGGTATGTRPAQDRHTTGTNDKKDARREEGKESATHSVRSLPEPDRFQEFWDTYPHRNGAKKNRRGAEAKFARLVKAGVSQQAIIDGAAKAHRDAQVQRGFARDPTTWLNQAGWEDDIETEQPRQDQNRGNTNGRLSADERTAIRERVAARFAGMDSGEDRDAAIPLFPARTIGGSR